MTTGDCVTRVEQTMAEVAHYVRNNFASLCAAVARQVASVAGGLPPGFDAERWTMEALTKALASTDELDDSDEAHAEFLAYWRRSLVLTARNAAIDDFRKEGRVQLADDPNALPPEPTWERVEAPDLQSEVAERIDKERRLEALTTVLQVLCARGGSPTATRITAEGWETLQTYAWVRKRGTDSKSGSTPADDSALHREAVTINQRRREEWAKDVAARRAGIARVERDGLRQATADELGVSATTVATRLRRVAEAVRFTRYVAGVLAHRGSLRHPRCVTRHLDVADALPTAKFIDERRTLSFAAMRVITTEDRGTRVDANALTGEAALTCDISLDQVHAAESLYIDLTGATSPNCVTVCARHTRNGAVTRATEI